MPTKRADASGAVTPMRRQYLDLKARHPGAILFFRLGDFYETFDEDAETCAALLQITLTGREMGRGVRVPMAGVPAHAVQGYLARLVAQGRSVAICEQVDAGGTGVARAGAPRSMMAREVTRVVTPGTVVEPTMLDGRRNNYLVAIVTATARGKVATRAEAQWAGVNKQPADLVRRVWGLAYADVSTGEFRCTQIDGPDADAEVRREIARIDPTECVLPHVSRDADGNEQSSAASDLCEGRVQTPWDAWRFEVGTATETLKRRFGVATLAGYGLDGLPWAVGAAGALVAYLDRTHGARGPSLDGVVTYSPERFVRLDPFTRRNLEIDPPLRRSDASLMSIIDETRTAVGSRLLRRWLGQPLADVREITTRHDAVATFVADGARRGTVRACLGSVADIERIASRASQGGATPRELHALARSLARASDIAEALGVGRREATAALGAEIDPCEDVQALIARAIHFESASESQSGSGASAPAKGDPLGAERRIRPGYSDELDGLIAGVQDARRWIARLEGVERERTGIAGLKVTYNRVFGYAIHVPTRFVDRVPTEYMRRQTVADGERFITVELKAKEGVVIEAAAAIERVERAAFDGVLAEVASQAARLRATAGALARIDVIAGLAEAAVRRGYVRPVVDESVGIEIRDGRHPVVEATLDGAHAYVPNECVVDADDRWAMILTGPNMAGKSTYLRSIALMVILAQTGSFVPASYARIGVVDRVFTRVGAHDELAAGRSTFMVEMVEAAQILRHATRRSLVILDEIGRGTSTHDGLAIAQAVIEYLQRRDDAGGEGGRPRTLFATHYHELAALEKSLPGVVNARLDVLEEGSRVTFLHRVVPGAAGRSYGIHVARLAGMPRAVTDRAALLLDALEEQSFATRTVPASLESDDRAERHADDPSPASGSVGRVARRHFGRAIRDEVMQLTLFAPPTHPVAEALQAIDLDGLTPREALNTLARLRAMVDEGHPE
jgi:DNA mismatch repair protein MutS